MPRLGDEAGAAGFSLVTLETVDSTNRLALDLAQQAGANKTWVLSETQRAGRGRHGRDWASPPGNFYGSLLLVSPCAPETAPQLGFVAGVAVAETMIELGIADARIKWPNDVLAGGGKLAGILLEGRALGKDRQAVAIGIGVNIVSAPVLSEGRAVSMRDLGVVTDRRAVFRRLSNRMAHWHRVFSRGAGFLSVRQAWADLSIAPGTQLTVKLPGATRSGRFSGIDEHGRLLLSNDGAVTRIEAGDVFLTGDAHG